jgi:hypothetical protein
MSSIPPGWYPDPSGRAGLRYFDGGRWTEHANAPPGSGGFAAGAGPQARRGLPNWAWAAIAVGLALIVSVVVAVVVFKSGPPMPDDSSALSTGPAGPPPGSELIPEMEMPPGTTRRDYTSHEHFDVPLPYADTVEALGPQLPIGRAYDGLAWCTESNSRGDSTTWSWGNESDYLSVWVYPAPQGSGSEVQVAREPEPSGCRP